LEVSARKVSDRELVIVIKGEGHTLGNLVAKACINNPHIDFATYRTPHPLMDLVEITIVSKDDYPVERALKEVIDELKAQLSALSKLIEDKL